MLRSVLLFAVLLLSPTVNAELLNDPTRPPLSQPAKITKSRQAPAPIPTLQLNGITISRQGDGHSAIINGQRVGIGDRISGATVEDIRPAAVMLSHDGKRITLEFAPGVHKRRSQSE